MASRPSIESSSDRQCFRVHPSPRSVRVIVSRAIASGVASKQDVCTIPVRVDRGEGAAEGELLAADLADMTVDPSVRRSHLPMRVAEVADDPDDREVGDRLDGGLGDVAGLEADPEAHVGRRREVADGRVVEERTVLG